MGSVETISASIGITEYAKRHDARRSWWPAPATVLDRARAAGGGRIEVRGARPDATGPMRAPTRTPSRAWPRRCSSATATPASTPSRWWSSVEPVARGLAPRRAEIDKIRHAALLHDIGKVAIPDEILHKAGQLNDDEWEVMRQHPAIGERILRAIPGLGGVARIVRHEHERFDGGGYPDGLAGKQIPIGSRIILACDAYHAMTSDRPYRKAMDHAEAIRELAASAGTQFDPEVTELLIGCLYGQAPAGPAAQPPKPVAA